MADKDLAQPGDPLTPRELEVLALRCSGCTLQQIADELGISFHTVNDHTKAIHTKLEVDGAIPAAYRAGKEGIV